MKKLNRLVSLVLCAAMLLGMFPLTAWAVNNDNGTCTITLSGNIYKLVDAPTAGKNYLILNSNTAGSANALSRNGNNIANQTVTVKAADAVSSVVYVENVGSATVWTATSGLRFYNGDRYLSYNTSGSSWNRTYSLVTNTRPTNFTYSNQKLYFYAGNAERYIRYSNSWGLDTNSNNATNVVYFYEEVSVSGGTTYSLSASKQQVLVNESINVDSIAKSILRDDTAIEDTLGGTYSYEVKSGNNTVLKLENGALTGLEAGTATVRVTYTWGDNQEHKIWKEIPVTVKNPYFTVDIQENGTSISVLAVKNIKHGENEERTTKQLTAQVLSNNTTPMEGVTVVWTSSNEKIVTVDSTGKLTFTGTEGTANVFAVYKFAEGEEYTDRVTVTASRDAYITTADGTNDFPEYPNEGSIRFDKTAQAVGDFNKTGIAQVELSMTGVPYSKGVDVIVMLDMSSSMTRCIYCNKKSGESGGCNNFRSRQTELEDAMAELQQVLQASDNAANIRIAVADFNGTQSFGPTQYNANNHVDRTQDVGALTNAGNQKVYTGPNAGNGGTTVTDNNRRTLLSAQAFIPVSQLDVSKFNYAPSTGTNYDYGFDAVYQLGYAIKQKNIADNDPDRELFVIFMSDGASNQFNYYNTTGGQSGNAGTSDWDKWLTGNIGEGKDYSFSEIIECTTHSYYFDAATGNQHRMANAIKGNPNQKYEVIRKNQNLIQNQNQGGNDAVTEILEATGQDNLYKIPGLGATTYTIAFYVINDGNISAESAKHSLRATASSQNHYIEAEEEGAIGAAFKNIAGQIVEAAKDVVVTDQMADEYTMVFEAPNKGAADNLPSGQEFYIEILDYTLNQTTHEREGEGTSLMKLYMGQTIKDGKIHYHAASNKNGTQYADPVFAQKPLGSMYYWTTTDITGSSTYSGVSVTINEVTYYFDFRGIKQAEGEAVPKNWYNMTSGAFASGTVTEDIHDDVLGNKDDTSYANDLIIATPYFVYNASTKMLYWTLEKIGRNETVLRYFLYLDESAGYRGDLDVDAGSYPTNEGADLTYTNYQDNPVQQEFPKPQMTWHGAQVTYVFYLVNSDGQPVNRAGRVVPFTEAVYVTDSYTESVIWSEDDQRNSLVANTLAKDIVPSVYTLYDEDAYYNVHVFANEEEMGADNHFQIGGNSSKVRSTYVFNTKADKNMYNEYGTYAKQSIDKVDCTVVNSSHDNLEADHHTEPGLDYYDTTVAFAVLWIPALSPEEIVVDYGLDVVVDVTQNDLAAAEPIGLMATPPLQDNGDPVEINKGQFEDPTVYESLNLSVGGKQIATATLEGHNIRITLNRTNGMHFTSDILFYYVSQVQFYDDHGALQSEYMYTSFRVIPATSMYYEEDYVTFDDKWSPHNGTPNPNATQDVDRPGPNRVGAGYDADNPYGYDNAYRGCTEYSLNSAKVTTVQDGVTAFATFDFTGTGFDIIGRTDNETTSIVVTVDDAVEPIFVDTYYEGTDGVNAINQVPVVTVRNLNYGFHRVRVEVVLNNDEGADFAHGDTGKFYLDAVRIYDPTMVVGYVPGDTVAEAYKLDGECYPKREEFGNEVLKHYGADKMFSFVTFVDRNGTTSDINEYQTWGPNNELYLAAEQSIRLTVDGTFQYNLITVPGASEVADVQIGFKLASGSSTTVTILNDKGVRIQKTLNSATDLNFSIKDCFKDGETITITNSGSDLLSITTIKVTLAPAEAKSSYFLTERPDEIPTEPVEDNQSEEPTEVPESAPEAPNTVIARAILKAKETFAAVIIAVANGMEKLSNWLEDVADSIFAGGG